MESKKGSRIEIKSLKGVFNWQATRVNHKFLGQMGEMILTRVREHLRILKSGLK